MLDRRSCIKAGVLATGTLAMGKAGLALASKPVPTKGGIRENLGIALYTIRTLMPEKINLEILTQISEIGYKEVELFGFSKTYTFINDPLLGHSPKALSRLFHDFGLNIPSAQVYTGDIAELAFWAEIAKEIGIEYLIESLPPEFVEFTSDGPVITGVKDLNQVSRISERLNVFGETLKKYEISFAYHNHNTEFKSFGEKTAFDHLLANTDPELVKIELDTGWAHAAGVKSADILKQYPNRVIACHLKDHDPRRPLNENSEIPESGQIVAPGDGLVDFSSLFEVMDKNGIKHGFVEDEFPKDPMATARRSYHYLKHLK